MGKLLGFFCGEDDEHNNVPALASGDRSIYKQVQEEASYYSIGSIAAASYRESMLRGYDGYVHTTCSIFSLWTLSYYVYVSARDTPITRLYQGLCG